MEGGGHQPKVGAGGDLERGQAAARAPQQQQQRARRGRRQPPPLRTRTQARPGVSGVFNLVPAGLLQRKRKYVAARFPQASERQRGGRSRRPAPTCWAAAVAGCWAAARACGAARRPQGPPNFKGDLSLGVDAAAAPVIRPRDGAPAPPPKQPALLLGAKGGAGRQMQGLPRTDQSSTYFVLMKSGRDFSVYPLEGSYTFKPVARPTAVTIEEVEAAQRGPAAAAAASAAADAALLMPRSLRAALKDEAAAAAADRRLREEAGTVLEGGKVAELAVRYAATGSAAAGAGGGGGSKLVLHADDDEEGGSDDMDFGGDDDDDAARRRAGKGPRRDEPAGRGGGGGARGKAGKGAAGPDIPEDEAPEDIYAGEEDELRPERPTKADDWEFEADHDDDDLAQGASDEEGLDDDPGLRRELGIEGDEEEEEEKKKREAELAADAEAAAAGGAGGAAGGAEGELEGELEGDGEGDMADLDGDDDDYGDDYGEDFDADDLDRLAAERENDTLGGPALKRRKQSAGSGGSDRSPAPAALRAATPPGGGTPGGGRDATPPVGAPAARGGGQLTPPQGGGQRLTPPASGGAKRKRDPAEPGGDGEVDWLPRPEVDAQGVPTTESIAAALRMAGPILTDKLNQLTVHFLGKSASDEAKILFKRRLLMVARVEVIDGRKHMVLK
ncbi:hypothetical protein HT031_004797 [Scenedesmus sp. PABB004]|nr:hypothetical protein HT031_004797 [Scenedesmus sp. PABB004]